MDTRQDAYTGLNFLHSPAKPGSNSLLSGSQYSSRDMMDRSDSDDSLESQKNGEAFQVANPHVRHLYQDAKPDFLYHLGLAVDVDRTPEIFGDVQYVCVGGTAGRVHQFALYCLDVLNVQIPTGFAMADLCGAHARYVMYKAGPVLTVSHGMGNPSLSIMVHEILKLLQYARAKKPITMIRIGTCGGIGIEPGTTIISENVFNGLFQSHLEQYVLGRPVRHPAILDRQLREDLIYHASKPEMNIPVVSGNTLCSNDFYEEQGRLDGAFCDFTHEDQMEYLGRCANVYGIRNFEMESLAFAAMTHRAGVRAAVVCVALVNRLISDKVSLEVEQHLEELQLRPQRLVAELIRHELLQQSQAFLHQDHQLHALRTQLEHVTMARSPSQFGGKVQVMYPNSDEVAVARQYDSAQSCSPGESSECCRDESLSKEVHEEKTTAGHYDNTTPAKPSLAL